MKAIIAEDEMVVAYDLARILRGLGYTVPGTATRASEALELVREHQPDVVFVDIILKGETDGIALAHTLREEFSMPYLFITAHADSDTVERARAARPSGYIVKPFTRDDVYAATEIALGNFRNEQGTKEEDKDTSQEPVASESGGLPSFRLRKVQRYIGDHLDDDLTLDQLADVAGISKHHFSHLFKESMGVSPYQYVIRRRLDEAKHLLVRTDLSITRVALRTGFSSHSHLSKAFRNVEGVSPSAFRAERRG